MSTSMEYALVERNAGCSLLVVAVARIQALEDILSTTLRVLTTFQGKLSFFMENPPSQFSS